MISLICGILTMIQMAFLQSRNRLAGTESKLSISKGAEEGRRGKLGLWD